MIGQLCHIKHQDVWGAVQMIRPQTVRSLKHGGLSAHWHCQQADTCACRWGTAQPCPEMPCVHWRLCPAGRVWRLVYMCNPRLVAAAQQAHQDEGSTASSWVGSWSQLFNLQLLGPLLGQMQQQGALSCNLSEAPSCCPHQRGPAAVKAEAVESLREAVTADVSDFCGRHPAFVHWLHNTAFELEWSHSKAAAHVATWDP